MQPADVLGVVADVCGVLTLVGVVGIAVAGSRLRAVVIAWSLARVLVPFLPAGRRGARARMRLGRACRRRLTSERAQREIWDVAGEVLWLSAVVEGAVPGSVAALSWARPERAEPLADALRRYARRLEISVWASLGSSELATEEARRAGLVAARLEDDAEFAAVLPTAAAPAPLVDLGPLGIDVLAGPAWCTPDPSCRTAQRRTFDEVRVTSRSSAHGAFGPFGALADRWTGVSGAERAALHARAQVRTADLAAAHPDTYNGELPRLLDWRVEAAVAGPTRRLHLHTERTTFATWLVTNAAPEDHRPTALDGRGLLPAGANHLPVTIGLVSADGYVVLPQRASDVAVYPDSFGSAANGNVELRSRHGAAADLGPDGTVDVVGAALRECREELGSGIDLERDDLRVAVLARYSDARETRSPVLVLTARSEQPFVEIVRGTRLAHPVEGAFELGREVLGVPMTGASPGEVVPWLRDRHADGALTTPALLSTLVLLEETAGASAVRDALARPADGARPASVLVRLRAAGAADA